jgi:hypothetical protein
MSHRHGHVPPNPSSYAQNAQTFKRRHPFLRLRDDPRLPKPKVERVNASALLLAANPHQLPRNKSIPYR